MNLADQPVAKHAPRLGTLCSISGYLFAFGFLGTVVVAVWNMVARRNEFGPQLGFMDATFPALVNAAGWGAFQLLGWIGAIYLRHLAMRTEVSGGRGP